MHVLTCNFHHSIKKKKKTCNFSLTDSYHNDQSNKRKITRHGWGFGSRLGWGSGGRENLDSDQAGPKSRWNRLALLQLKSSTETTSWRSSESQIGVVGCRWLQESASHRPSAEQKPAKRFTPSEILIGKEAVFAGEEKFSPVTRPFFFFDWKVSQSSDSSRWEREREREKLVWIHVLNKTK